MILDSIDRALERIYARRRRLAIILCLALFASAAVVLSIYPDLFNSVMKVPKKEQTANSDLSKVKKKKITKKKRRPMPKALRKEVKKKKKKQLKTRMIAEVKRMVKKVENLERIEKQRMEELEAKRDTKEDMMRRINEVAEIVKEKAHLFNNKDSREEATAMDREASELDRKINEELKKMAQEKSNPNESAESEKQLNELADQAQDLAKRLDEASKTADPGESQENAKDASLAAEDLADSLKDLAKNDFSELNQGLADSETNPMRSVTKPLEEMTVQELHDLSQDMAAQANDLYTDIKAAEKAMANNESFNDSLASQEITDYQKNQLDGKTPSTQNTEDSKNSRMNPEGESMDDFANFEKDALRGIKLASSSINRNERLADPNVRAAALAAAMGAGRGGGGTGSGVGKGRLAEGFGGKARSGPDDKLREQAGGVWNHTGMDWRDAVENSKYHFTHQQLLDILPARRFSKNSKRKGWFYIDSWYVIGPWTAPWANNRVDYRVTFPPEDEIDLEANYGTGADGKPLTWKFKQFDSVLMAMDPQWRNSAHYLYTELYFENAQDMVLSVAADDTAKVWVNDRVVIEESTMSDWALNESFRKVHFHRGFNKVLVRCQNGPGENDLSVILASEDVISRK
jgi:hypothetical protein